MTTTARSTADLLVSIYRDVLGIDDLDRDADFYAAGGDSLSAFQIIGRLHEETGVELPVSLVFAYPTPADLAEVVDTDFADA